MGKFIQKNFFINPMTGEAISGIDLLRLRDYNKKWNFDNRNLLGGVGGVQEGLSKKPENLYETLVDAQRSLAKISLKDKANRLAARRDNKLHSEELRQKRAKIKRDTKGSELRAEKLKEFDLAYNNKKYWNQKFGSKGNQLLLTNDGYSHLSGLDINRINNKVEQTIPKGRLKKKIELLRIKANQKNLKTAGSILKRLGGFLKKFK